jgi:hypothetical protein
MQRRRRRSRRRPSASASACSGCPPRSCCAPWQVTSCTMLSSISPDTLQVAPCTAVQLYLPPLIALKRSGRPVATSKLGIMQTASTRCRSTLAPTSCASKHRLSRRGCTLRGASRLSWAACGLRCRCCRRDPCAAQPAAGPARQVRPPGLSGLPARRHLKWHRRGQHTGAAHARSCDSAYMDLHTHAPKAPVGSHILAGGSGEGGSQEVVLLDVGSVQRRAACSVLAAQGGLMAGSAQWLGLVVAPLADALHQAQLQLSAFGPPGTHASFPHQFCA